MRVLKVVCGLAILLNALHLVHAMQHFWVLDSDHGAGFWAGLMVAVAVAMLSVIGAALLIRQARNGTTQARSGA